MSLLKIFSLTLLVLFFYIPFISSVSVPSTSIPTIDIGGKPLASSSTTIKVSRGYSSINEAIESSTPVA